MIQPQMNWQTSVAGTVYTLGAKNYPYLDPMAYAHIMRWTHWVVMNHVIMVALPVRQRI